MERTNERDSQGEMVCRKKPRISKESVDLFGTLPDDVITVIFGKLCSSARSPPDFINVLSTCKRLNRLALEPAVLKQAGMFTVAVRFEKWSEYSHRFIMKCVRAGSVEAVYFLRMFRRYAMGWFGKYLCSDPNCARLETRVNEFMKCSGPGCSKARYCSRECLPEPQQEYDAVDEN